MFAGSFVRAIQMGLVALGLFKLGKTLFLKKLLKLVSAKNYILYKYFGFAQTKNC